MSNKNNNQSYQQSQQTQQNNAKTETQVQQTTEQPPPPSTVLDQIQQIKSAQEASANKVQAKPQEPKKQVINAQYLKNVPATAFPVIENIDKLAEDIKKNGSDAQKALVSSMETYLTKMAPGIQINPNDGVVRQYALWRAIKKVLENDPQTEFKGLWTILLAYVKANINGCFAHTHRYRFTERWTKSQSEFNGLNNILNLLVVTCEPEGRKNVNKEVQLKHALGEGLKDTARARVYAYYTGL